MCIKRRVNFFPLETKCRRPLISILLLFFPSFSLSSSSSIDHADTIRVCVCMCVVGCALVCVRVCLCAFLRCSILGMYLFGGKFCMHKKLNRQCTCSEIMGHDPLCECDRKHFNNILWATVTVFQVSDQPTSTPKNQPPRNLIHLTIFEFFFPLNHLT